MLKISNDFKEPIVFEYAEDGVSKELSIVQRSIGDAIKYQELLKEAADLNGDIEKGVHVMQASIVTSIKDDNGDYAFEFGHKFTDSAFSELFKYVSEMNPSNSGLEEAKK